MGLLNIDESKCKKDGICINECPSGIIGFEDSDGCPGISPENETACILCGHCVSVCPHGALSHSRIPIEECPAIDKGLLIGHDQAIQFLRSRRSIRRFKDKSVERDKISKLIEIARYAPTSGNTQLVEWMAFTDRRKLKEISELTIDCLRKVIEETTPAALPPYLPRLLKVWDAGHDSVLRGAPVLILAFAPKRAVSGLVDLTLSLSYLDLLAPTMGLGTTWAGLVQRGLLNWQPLREAMGLPEGYPHHFPMMLGYPQFKYNRLPERKPPKIDWR